MLSLLLPLPQGLDQEVTEAVPERGQSWGPQGRDHIQVPTAMAAPGQRPSPVDHSLWAPISAPPLGSLNMYILLHALLEYRALLTDDKS